MSAHRYGLVVEDTNALILLCDDNEDLRTWQKRLQGAIYRASGPATISSISEISSPAETRSYDIAPTLDVVYMERLFVTGVLDELRLNFISFSTDDDDYMGYDYSLTGQFSEVRIVYLNRFVQEVSYGYLLCLSWWSKGVRKRQVQRGLAIQKPSVGHKKVDLEECYSAAEMDLPITKKGSRCEATDSNAMGMVVRWYCKGGTSMESSIPCSHEGRALVVKGIEKVENTKANSKYQDKAEGQRSENFIRPVLMGFSSK
ncbi:hypothetical protein B296_00039801 [Ensete ventricosum]|uniref:PH domain-containing protein n=1 Tax=Ensete ventricosum TaxID=4639 RepID=A0A426ZSB5_ENSVE|nr:hypothetical protein B296_00039801 [Ensete ventricosum]